MKGVSEPMANTVLVTGADGFIGSHLTEELVKRGEKVKAFNKTTTTTTAEQSGCRRGYRPAGIKKEDAPTSSLIFTYF